MRLTNSKVYLLTLLPLLILGCTKRLPPNVVTTFEQELWRTQGVTCDDLTQHEEGDPPSCEAIYHYYMMAVDKMTPILGPKVAKLRMDNATYIRKVRIWGHTYPSGYEPFTAPAIEMQYHLEFPEYPTPVYATVTRTGLTPSSPYIWKHQILYASEESIYCEALHMIADELDQTWWAHVGHWEDTIPETHDDPLMSNCHDWAIYEYQRLNPTPP